MLGVMGLMMMIDHNLRLQFAALIDPIFSSTIGFDYSLPVVTLFCTGLFMMTFNTTVRHMMVDWVDTARNQKIMSKFNKELFAARKQGNQAKIKKLTELQPEMMARNMENMKKQFKTMAVTMFLLLIVFTWLSLFIGRIPSSNFTVPWSSSVDLQGSFSFLPQWLMLYSLLSIPASMLIGRILKHFTYTKRLRQLERLEQV